jgi:hypothetical protein
MEIVVIKKLITLFFTLTVIATLAGCCCSNPNYQKNNEDVPTNAMVRTNTVEAFAKQFSPELATYFMNHPEVVDDIRCQLIPINIDTPVKAHEEKQLCILAFTTYEPFYSIKTTVFVKNKNNEINVLTNFIDDESSYLSHIAFSESGKFLYLILTDEGHPFFVFFDTQKFINNDADAQVGGLFEEYFLDHIETFYDNGDIVYALREGTITGCLSNGEVEIEPKTDNSEQVKRCLFHHNIFEKYNSFGSTRDTNEPFIPTSSKRRVIMPYVCNAFN